MDGIILWNYSFPFSSLPLLVAAVADCWTSQLPFQESRSTVTGGNRPNSKKIQSWRTALPLPVADSSDFHFGKFMFQATRSTVTSGSLSSTFSKRSTSLPCALPLPVAAGSQLEEKKVLFFFPSFLSTKVQILQGYQQSNHSLWRKIQNLPNLAGDTSFPIQQYALGLLMATKSPLPLQTWTLSNASFTTSPLLLAAAYATLQETRRVTSHFQPSQRRAYAQQLVTTRLLDYLHDPARQLSRLQRIQSCALYNCNTPANSPNFNETVNAGLVRFWAKGLFVSDWCRRKSPRSGMDSDLEAFSHNPADGSFAAMPGRTAAKTNYLNPRFLSY